MQGVLGTWTGQVGLGGGGVQKQYMPGIRGNEDFGGVVVLL